MLFVVDAVSVGSDIVNDSDFVGMESDTLPENVGDLLHEDDFDLLNVGDFENDALRVSDALPVPERERDTLLDLDALFETDIDNVDVAVSTDSTSCTSTINSIATANTWQLRRIIPSEAGVFEDKKSKVKFNEEK